MEKQAVANGTEPSEESCAVAVAVHIRPLISSELVDGCQECLAVAREESQARAKTSLA